MMQKNNNGKTAPGQDILETARELIELGCSLIPVGRDKKALIPWKEYQERRASGDEVRGWLRRFPAMNLGIVTGEISGLVVVDCDSEKARRRLDQYLSGTRPPEVKTPKGYHLYFEYAPGLKNAARVLPKIDIRTDGGYVVAPGSLNADGGKYEWLISWEVTHAE